MSGVEEHRQSVDRALNVLGLGWEAWPDLVVDARLEPDVQLAAVLVLVAEGENDDRRAGSIPMIPGASDDAVDWQGRARHPWEQLSRLRLPWTAATAAVALESVSRARTYDDRRCALALRGAREVCRAGHADTVLMEALVAAVARLDEVSDEEWRITDVRALARRVLAAATPPDLLDLSLLVDGDDWVGAARDAVRELPAGQVAPLVRLLGDLGPRKPSKRWLSEVEQALLPVAARQLLRRWVEIAADADIVPEWPGSRIGDCLGTLFVGTNTEVVRAAVWATGCLSDEEWASQQLGVLARRGAAHNGAPGFPEALSLRVASASVDTLIARGGPADRRVLAELLEDLQRRDLVKKIGASLGRGQDAARREDELTRTKAQAVRRQASPAPRKARAAVDSLIRQHLGACLRALGFTGGPRTWRRTHEDRVDVIAVGGGHDLGTGRNRLDLAYGTYVDAAHPGDDPWPMDRAKVSDRHLDIRIFDHDPFIDDPHTGDQFGEDYLEAIAARLRDVVVPLLDRLGDYDSVAALLLRDDGLPPGAALEANPGSAARSQVLGMLALAAGDRATAVAHLQSTVQWVESWAEDQPQPAASGGTVVAYWTDKLERARKLA